jgi:hypothetical protein
MLTARQQLINKFIKLTDNGDNLRIDFDNLAFFLLKDPKIKFSVHKFETLLKSEVEKKLLNRPFTENEQRALCDYIDQLAKYLTREMINVERGRFDKISNRPRRTPKS